MLKPFFYLTVYPLKFIQKGLFKFLILPVYDKYRWFRIKYSSKADTTQDKIILSLTNHYVIHGVVIIMAVLITTSNILAYENNENYGQDALIYNIVGLENLETIEDAYSVIDESGITSYQGENTFLRSHIYSEAQKREEEILDEQQDSVLATTQGGTTLVKPDLVSTEAAKITRTSVKEYEVKEGDSIGSIASDFDVSVNTLLWANNLSSYSIIKPGQKLAIPPTSGVLHTVKSGDTLLSIAKKYDAEAEKIREYNRVGSDDLLAVGETIMVPGGRIIYTSAPRTYASTVDTPTYTVPTLSSDGKMYWPSECRRITQYYRGWRHTGVDIACGNGKTIRAVQAGVVSRTQYLRYGYGYNVIIDHGNGLQTLYGHFSRILVQPGQKVQKGEVIGLEGSTGYSTGAHLHFEVRINGNRVNPLNYIR